MMEFFRFILALPPGASTVADEIDGLHIFVITVTMTMSTVVFAMAAWFTIRYHRRHEDQLTRHLTASTLRETLIIGSLLGVFLLWWLIGYRQYLKLRAEPVDAEVVYVDAKQWMWKFAYVDGRVSNDVLTVPVGRPVKLVMTSRDVIHSFYVPAFRVKSDVLPGRYTTVWFEVKEPGTHPIFCAEYCGLNHSLMRGDVIALPPTEYARWKAMGADAMTKTDCGRGPGSCGGDDLVSHGRMVAERRQCVACHTLDGQRHIGPTWSRLYGSVRVLVDGRHVIADEAYLTRSMMEPSKDVVDGYADVMPIYQGLLSASETAALVELIRSLRDGPAETSGAPLPRIEITPMGDAGGPTR
ncbi:MAG TPA: cytochrome c oxidase subunit II [Labilithrix sp.]|nr:cytochrome c oxidase subunit II [Labilithrix sp.]